MFKKIVVPLDGSKAAEEVLPQLEEMIRLRKVESVILLRVVRYAPEVAIDYIIPPDTVASIDKANRREAQEYLTAIEGRIDWRGIPHRTEVLMGFPEVALSRFAEKEEVELVLMAEHTPKSLFHGLRRCLADRLLHVSSVPVEVFHPAASLR